MQNRDKEYLFFKSVVEDNRDLLKRFVYNPQEVLQQLKISEESVKCPDKAHEALKRANEVSKKVQEISLETDSLTEGLPQVTKLIEESFGKDFEVSVEPFGVRFSEVVVIGDGILDTGTATVGGTFGSFDNIRPDVDR